jgi:hypothetical protein
MEDAPPTKKTTFSVPSLELCLGVDVLRKLREQEYIVTGNIATSLISHVGVCDPEESSESLSIVVGEPESNNVTAAVAQGPKGLAAAKGRKKDKQMGERVDAEAGQQEETQTLKEGKLGSDGEEQDEQKDKGREKYLEEQVEKEATGPGATDKLSGANECAWQEP